MEEWGFLLRLTKYSTMLCLAGCCAFPPALPWDGVILIKFHGLHWIFCVHADSWSWKSGSQVVLNGVVTNPWDVFRGGSGKISSSFSPKITWAVWYQWLQTAPKAVLSRDLGTLSRDLGTLIQSRWLSFPHRCRCQLGALGAPPSSAVVNACHMLMLQERLLSSAPLRCEFAARCEVARARYTMRCRQGEKCFSWRSQKRAKHLWEAGASGTPTFANCSWVSWR